jgi:hypothetical protein
LTQRRQLCAPSDLTKEASSEQRGKEHKTFRYPLPWTDPDFYDKENLEKVDLLCFALLCFDLI